MQPNLELFNRYQNLAYKIANKFSKSKPWIKDEIESAALFGLWEAVKQEAQGNPVSFYSVIIRNQITYQTKRLDRPLKGTPGSWRNKDEEKPEFLSLNFHDLNDESFRSDTLMGTVVHQLGNQKSTEEILIEKEEDLIKNSKLELAISELDKDQEYIMRSLLKGKAVKDLSFERGCSDENINKQKRKAISILKEKLN